MDVSQEAGVGRVSERAAAASGMVLLTLASAQFLMTLDSSVMNVSIATVGAWFRSGSSPCSLGS
jgi:hypothetical protein